MNPGQQPSVQVRETSWMIISTLTDHSCVATGVDRKQEKLLATERANFKLLAQKVNCTCSLCHTVHHCIIT